MINTSTTNMNSNTNIIPNGKMFAAINQISDMSLAKVKSSRDESDGTT